MLVRLSKFLDATAFAILLTVGIASQCALPIAAAQSAQTAGTANVAVGPEYGTTHVYVEPKDFNKFVPVLLATFGGSASKPAIMTVTPTPSSTKWQAVRTPVGNFSVFG